MNWLRNGFLDFPSFFFKNKTLRRCENVTCLDKVEKIAPEDREHVRSELYSLAQWLKSRYDLTVKEVRRFLYEVLDLSV